MADVFLSYARADRELVGLLATELSDRGFSVWWDTSLVSGDNFRQEILSELNEARAVIVLWSQASKDSEWVISEAQRASRAGKLIPIRRPDLDPTDIPQPFDVRHSEAIENRAAIFAALEKHGVKPSGTARKNIVYQLEEVFRIADPTVTFIDRSETAEFKKIATELRLGGRIVRLYGQSKSGKTVLCRQALSGVNPIELHGRSIDNLSDFFNSLSAEIGLVGAHTPAEVEHHLLSMRRPILIDDFHQVPAKTRIAIIRKAKRYLDAAITVIVFSIPDCAKQAIDEDGELLFRSEAIKAPTWSTEELHAIAKRGFDAMNVEVPLGSIDALISHSFRNPLLVQDYCKQLCKRYDILETQPRRTRIGATMSDVESILKDTARRIGAHFEGVLGFSGEKQFTLRTGHSVAVGALVLLAISSIGVMNPIKISRIAIRAKEFLPEGGTTPGASLIQNSASSMAQKLDGKKSRDLAVALIGKHLYILHPYFKVYLLWRFCPQIIGTFPDLGGFVYDDDVVDTDVGDAPESDAGN